MQCVVADSDRADCVHSYNIPMRVEVVDGRATLAWIWLSRVTAETYMNCGPVHVSGTASLDGFAGLPSLQRMTFDGLRGNGDFLASLAPLQPARRAASSTVEARSTAATPASVLTPTDPPVSTIAMATATAVAQAASECGGLSGAIASSGLGYLCIDGATFGECVSGCAVRMNVSAGTVCGPEGLVFAETHVDRVKS